jgi:hypothetical protein
MPTRVFQPNFSGGILGEGMYARTDTTKYASGVKDAVNMLIRTQGGMANRAGFRIASGFDTSALTNIQWNIPFTLTNQSTAVLEFTEDVVHVIFDGAYVIDSSFTAKDVVAVDYAATGRLEMASGVDAATYTVGELVYLDDPAGDLTIGEQVLRVASISGEFITFETYDKLPLDMSAGASLWGNLGAGAELKKVYSFAHSYDPGDIAFIRFAQDNLDMYLAHPGYAPQKLTFVALDDWVLAAHSFAPAVAAPASLTPTPSPAAAQSLSYAVSALADETLEEGLPRTASIANGSLSTGGKTVLTWPAVTGAILYNVYRQTASGYGYIGTTDALTFDDTNITPDQSIRPKAARNPFGSAGNYPGVVNFIEQRLAFAATDNQPQLIEMSKVAAFTNFTVSYPSQPDDGLRFRLRTRERNDIRSMVSGRALFVFTSSAEWVVLGNDTEGVLTPTSIIPKPESYFGSYDIEPVVVGDVAMFVEPDGATIRDFLLTLNPNATTQSRELTVLVKELFEGREITSWCYTNAPDRQVWVTLSDGSLMSMAYMAEHEIWGWTRHNLGGSAPFVYQVVRAREGVNDRLYAVVGRFDPFAEKEVVQTERLELRFDNSATAPFFVDAGLTYDNDSVTASQLSGLLHLRGQEVIALIDGDVIDGLTVNEAGVVNLGVEGNVVHVGLPYTSYLQTLPIDFETDELGSMVGRFKAVGEVAVSLKRSRGVQVGIRLDSLNELVEWEPSMIGGPIPLKTQTVSMTVDGDWVRDATVFVVQTYPLPMTVLGVAPDWEPGE